MTARIRLSLQDELFLRAESRTTPVHVGGLQIFKAPPRASAHFVSKLAARLREYPVSVPPLNYRLAAGLAQKVRPSWEIDAHVDLDCHFRLAALPGPGGERELGELISHLHSTPMDMSRPLWEYHLIEGLSGGRFATYTKLHHAMFDGAAGMRLVNLSSRRAASDVPPFWADESRRPRRSATPDRARALGRLPAIVEDEVRALPGLVRGLRTTALTALGLGREPDLASIGEAPPTLFNVRIGLQRRVATYRASLERVHAIGHAAGGTVNDVVLAACGGALRRYLAERDALPDRTLVAAVPMALHHDEGAAAGNAVTSLLARLGTDTDDVRERFATICRSTAAGKAQLKSMTANAAMQFVTLLSLPVLLRAWVPGVDRLTGPLANLIISNVPGPRERLYLHGAEQLAHFPVSQVSHGMALNITVLSYADGLYFGFVACPDTVPSMQRLAVHMDAAMKELEATFLPRPARKARAKRPRSTGR
jgi:WS/DGAT/MGAT family acyltransferase